MSFHRLAAAQLQGMWAEWETAKLLDRILIYDGSFVPRFVRGSRTVLSNHAFGSAFDINERYNKLGKRPALVGEKGSLRELVPIAKIVGVLLGRALFQSTGRNAFRSRVPEVASIGPTFAYGLLQHLATASSADTGLRHRVFGHGASLPKSRRSQYDHS